VFYVAKAWIMHVTGMVKCPDCKKEIAKSYKTWKYGLFNAAAYMCTCGTEFREYMKDGKHSFTLKRKKGERFVKA